MERLNGTVKSSLKPRRGYKKGSPIIEGVRVYYNHIRPHEGIGDLTPGEAAGLIVNGQVAHVDATCAPAPAKVWVVFLVLRVTNMLFGNDTVLERQFHT